MHIYLRKMKINVVANSTSLQSYRNFWSSILLPNTYLWDPLSLNITYNMDDASQVPISVWDPHDSRIHARGILTLSQTQSRQGTPVSVEGMLLVICKNICNPKLLYKDVIFITDNIAFGSSTEFIDWIPVMHRQIVRKMHS